MRRFSDAHYDEHRISALISSQSYSSMANRGEGKGIASDRPINRDECLQLAQLEPRAFVLSDAEELNSPAHAVAPEPSRRAASVSSDRAGSHGRSKDDLKDDHPRDTSKKGDILGGLKRGCIEARKLGEKRPKMMIGTEMLAILVASYNNHFSEYCKGRKNVTQRIPSKVWKSVYGDFLENKRVLSIDSGVNDDQSALPAERTLQDCLRGALKEQNTGTPDENITKHVTLQCEDTLTRLKQSDGHAASNMLKFRQTIMCGNPRVEESSSFCGTRTRVRGREE
jgi:hypothetical protein